MRVKRSSSLHVLGACAVISALYFSWPEKSGPIAMGMHVLTMIYVSAAYLVLALYGWKRKSIALAAVWPVITTAALVLGPTVVGLVVRGPAYANRMLEVAFGSRFLSIVIVNGTAYSIGASIGRRWLRAAPRRPRSHCSSEVRPKEHGSGQP